MLQKFLKFFLWIKELIFGKQILEPSEDKEDYYDNKYAKNDVFYYGRYVPGKHGVSIPTDVRHFIWRDDFFLNRKLKEFRLDGLSNDEKAYKIAKFVYENIKYVSDHESTTYTEFWQYPNETLTLGTGDCEDGAILMASMMICAGIPSYRVKVAAGYVDDFNGGVGGHGYCIYRRESDNQFVVCDWCYVPDEVPIDERTPLRSNKLYKDIWFTWNDKYSWSDFPLEVFNIKKRNIDAVIFYEGETNEINF